MSPWLQVGIFCGAVLLLVAVILIVDNALAGQRVDRQLDEWERRLRKK